MKSHRPFQEDPLSRIGERTILRKLVFPFFEGSSKQRRYPADDCAIVEFDSSDKSLVWTIDPAPLPVAWLVGDESYYTYGWYSVAINLSDVAAMGGTPYGILLSIVSPNNLKVGELTTFLEGVRDCCAEHGGEVMGGNIKDGNEFSCVVSALGTVRRDGILRRKGAREGDLIVSVGELGAFWAAVFARVHNITVESHHKERLEHALYKPLPRVREGQLIAQEKLATSCMDNSDSVIGCCLELAYQNALDFIITLTEDDLDPYYQHLLAQSRANPLTAACSWGDWNLICTVPPTKLEEMRALLEQCAARVTKIGYVAGTGGKAYYRLGDTLMPVNERVDSERFRGLSYFSNDISNYMRVLTDEKVWKDTRP